MQTYEFRGINSAGFIMAGRRLVCANDQVAMEKANQMARRYVKCEVWSGDVLIGTASAILAGHARLA